MWLLFLGGLETSKLQGLYGSSGWLLKNLVFGGGGGERQLRIFIEYLLYLALYVSYIISPPNGPLRFLPCKLWVLEHLSWRVTLQIMWSNSLQHLRLFLWYQLMISKKDNRSAYGHSHKQLAETKCSRLMWFTSSCIFCKTKACRLLWEWWEFIVTKGKEPSHRCHQDAV